MKTPVVSVIMAAYKGVGLVGETIASVLAQTFTDFELVIVDDCSPDNTLDILRNFDDSRIRVIGSPVNQGPVKTRNMAMAEARGRYIAGLDQDDICLPYRLERQVAYLDAHPEVVLVAAAADLLEEGRIRPGYFRNETSPEFIRWQLHLQNMLVWSTVMMRADVARRLDPITRPEVLFAEDFDLYHRISAFGTIARIDEPLLLYRIHPGGVSKTYQTVMVANATRVLTDVYGPIFGADAAESARLIIAHIAQGDPVPDRATLQRIGAIIAKIRARGFAARDPLIDHAISRTWWRLVRTAIRAGRVSPATLVQPRPNTVRFSDLDWGDMLLSSMIGTARRVTA